METDKNSKDIVSRYRRYLKLEKGYSANTLDAYMRDVDKLFRYLAVEQVDVLDVKLEDLEHFAAFISYLCIGPRSWRAFSVGFVSSIVSSLLMVI